MRGCLVECGILCSVWGLSVGWPDDIRLMVRSRLLSFARHPFRHARDFAKTYRHVC